MRATSTAPAGITTGEDGRIYGLRPSKRKGFHLGEYPNAVRFTSILLFLIAWEIYGRRISPIFMTYPVAIVKASFELLSTGELLEALLESLKGLVIGFSGAVVLGVIIGMAMGLYRSFDLALDPFVTALYSTPMVALIPLIMLWVGLGLTAKIVVIFLSCVFPVIMNAHAGVRDVSKTHVDVLRAYGATDRQIVTKVILPSALPFVMTGIRLAVGRGVIGMVVAEYFTSASGLGALLIIYSNSFATAKLFVPVITLTLLAMSLTWAARSLERRMASWKETERGV